MVATEPRGQMMRLFDVHVRDINEFDTQQKIDQLKVEVSKHLGLALKEDIEKMTPPEGASPMPFKPVDRLRQVIHDKQKCEL